MKETPLPEYDRLVRKILAYWRAGKWTVDPLPGGIASFVARKDFGEKSERRILIKVMDPSSNSKSIGNQDITQLIGLAAVGPVDDPANLTPKRFADAIYIYTLDQGLSIPAKEAISKAAHIFTGLDGSRAGIAVALQTERDLEGITWIDSSEWVQDHAETQETLTPPSLDIEPDLVYDPVKTNAELHSLADSLSQTIPLDERQREIDTLTALLVYRMAYRQDMRRRYGLGPCPKNAVGQLKNDGKVLEWLTWEILTLLGDRPENEPGRTADGGKDLVFVHRGLRDKVLVQCKNYSAKRLVSAREVYQMIGTMLLDQYSDSWFVAPHGFSEPAIKLIKAATDLFDINIQKIQARDLINMAFEAHRLREMPGQTKLIRALQPSGIAGGGLTQPLYHYLKNKLAKLGHEELMEEIWKPRNSFKEPMKPEKFLQELDARLLRKTKPELIEGEWNKWLIGRILSSFSDSEGEAKNIVLVDDRIGNRDWEIGRAILVCNMDPEMITKTIREKLRVRLFENDYFELLEDTKHNYQIVDSVPENPLLRPIRMRVKVGDREGTIVLYCYCFASLPPHKITPAEHLSDLVAPELGWHPTINSISLADYKTLNPTCPFLNAKSTRKGRALVEKIFWTEPFDSLVQRSRWISPPKNREPISESSPKSANLV